MKKKPKKRISDDRMAFIRLGAKVAMLARTVSSTIDTLEQQQKTSPNLQMITGYQATAGIIKVLKSFKETLIGILKDS